MSGMFVAMAAVLAALAALYWYHPLEKRLGVWRQRRNRRREIDLEKAAKRAAPPAQERS